MAPEFHSLLKLGRAERLQLVEDLWDSIAAEDTSDLSISEAKREELRCRKARFLRNPELGRTLDEVKDRARGS